MTTTMLPRLLPSTLRFVDMHNSEKADGLRLGQRFVILYVKQPWPELFYASGEAKASIMINRWLEDNQYINDLPQKLERTK